MSQKVLELYCLKVMHVARVFTVAPVFRMHTLITNALSPLGHKYLYVQYAVLPTQQNFKKHLSGYFLNQPRRI